MNNEVEIFFELAKGTIAGVPAWAPKTFKLLDTVLHSTLYKVIEIVKKSGPEKEKILDAISILDDRLKLEKSENLQDIATDIGIPIIERLAYISSPEIREIYIRMLNIAATKDSCKNFHPRHLEMIPSLSLVEIQFLKEFIVSPTKSILYYEHLLHKNGHSTFINIHDVYPRNFEKENMPLILENICSLGILKEDTGKISIPLHKDHVEYTEKNLKHLGGGRFKYILESDAFKNLREVLPKADEEYDHMEFKGRLYSMTPLGYYFMNLIFELSIGFKQIHDSNS